MLYIFRPVLLHATKITLTEDVYFSINLLRQKCSQQVPFPSQQFLAPDVLVLLMVVH